MKIIILKDLEDQVRDRLAKNGKPAAIYGQIYPEENLIQFWSLEPRTGLERMAEIRRTDGNGLCAVLADGTEAGWNDVEVVAYQSQFTSRIEGLLDTDRLAEKLVSLIGLGSVGSSLALLLAQSSVGRFRLIDMDTLSATNVSRHACDLRHLGRFKTKAVRELILARNPKARVEAFEEDFLKLSFEDQIARLEGSDLVIASTDANACQFAVNEACLYLKIPSLYIGCYERAQAGEIIYVLPNKTACLNCLVEFRRGSLRKLKKRDRRMPYSNEDPGGFKAEPGLAVDMAYVTSLAAGFALAMLDPESRRAGVLDPAKNLILLHSGNEPQGDYAKVFKMPFDYISGRTARSESCDLCRSDYLN